MKRAGLSLSIVMALASVVLIGALSARHPRAQPAGPSQARTISQEQQLALEKSAASQKRLNHYFHSDVIPKLKDCWSRIKGEGTVEIRHAYRRDATGRWLADNLSVVSSTLPAGQDAVALQCMQVSVRGTAFPRQSSDSSHDRFIAYWSWPVPFPRDFPEPTTERMAVTATGTRGGCDGKGAPARCFICAPGGCKKACNGGDACRTTNRSCVMMGDTCVSGGPTFSSGATIIQ